MEESPAYEVKKSIDDHIESSKTTKHRGESEANTLYVKDGWTFDRDQSYIRLFIFIVHPMCPSFRSLLEIYTRFFEPKHQVQNLSR